MQHSGVAVFSDVPYAERPFGERRFSLPVRREPWAGERSAVSAGFGYLQPWRRADPWDGYVNPVLQGEDMLTLRITTPDLGDAKLPVMVWIHGGGFVSGVGSAPASRGDTFARDGIVHVSINYRMSLDGYTLLEDSIDSGTENLGLRDQVAALEWVQRNIRAFGGDPDCVTIAGQSAGAVSVGYLLASPLASGLFHRAIIESGFPDLARTVEQAEAALPLIAAVTARRATRDSLRDLTLGQSRYAVARLDADFEGSVAAGRASISDAAFSGITGTESLPVGIVEGLVSGFGSGIPLLIGNTRDEGSGIVEKMGLLDDDLAARSALAAMGAPARAAESYRAASRHGASDGELISAVFTDQTARMPAIGALERRAVPGFLYEFAWQSPGRPEGMGADHVVDLPFVQDDFASFRQSCAAGDRILGDNPPRALARAMHGAFVDFVRSGDPGWAPYETSDRITMRFDTNSEALSDPAGPERRIWEGQR